MPWCRLDARLRGVTGLPARPAAGEQIGGEKLPSDRLAVDKASDHEAVPLLEDLLQPPSLPVKILTERPPELSDVLSRVATVSSAGLLSDLFQLGKVVVLVA